MKKVIVSVGSQCVSRFGMNVAMGWGLRFCVPKGHYGDGAVGVPGLTW